jgi:O-antigen ligase
MSALLALLFWQFQHTESVTVHRAISASNRSDFSWRNRVTAWEGALQMMGEKLWLGFGWNQPEPFYEQLYSESRLDETMAIEMNDYLMLGATLGLPALFCFCMYLWFSFTGSARREPRPTTDPDGRQLDWLKAVCRPNH